MTVPLQPERLADVEAISRLKFQLFRGMDTHDVDLIERCFTAEAEVDFGDGAYVASGRDEIGALFRRILVPGFSSSHIALHPEIEFDSSTVARGTWRFESTSLVLDTDLQVFGEQHNAGYYSDVYVKTDCWQLARSSYQLIFSIRTPAKVGDVRSVTTFSELYAHQLGKDAGHR